MKKELFLHVAEPCHENWNAMDKVEKGRFCMSCSKQVTDFTNMSDKQVLSILSKAAGNTCGRFVETQLQRPMAEQHSIAIKPYKFLFSALIPAFLLSNSASGQLTKNKAEKVIETREIEPIFMGKVAFSKPPSTPTQILFTGSVTNESGEPIPFASVYTSKLTKGTTCDSVGNFRLEVPFENKGELSASAAGFTSVRRPITGNETGKTLVLQLAKAPLPEVIVVGYTDKMLTGIVGGLSIVRKVTLMDTLKTMTARLTGTQMFSVYPNPATPGGDVFLKFKKPGAYSLQLFNNAGGLFLSKELVVKSPSEPTAVAMPATLTAGIYYLKATNKKDAKNYVGKLIVK